MVRVQDVNWSAWITEGTGHVSLHLVRFSSQYQRNRNRVHAYSPWSRSEREGHFDHIFNGRQFRACPCGTLLWLGDRKSWYIYIMIRIMVYIYCIRWKAFFSYTVYYRYTSAVLHCYSKEFMVTWDNRCRRRVIHVDCTMYVSQRSMTLELRNGTPIHPLVFNYQLKQNEHFEAINTHPRHAHMCVPP